MINNITIFGRIPSKKNSKILICRGTKPILLPSQRYAEWHTNASTQLLAYKGQKNISKCEIEAVFFSPDKRLWDLTNKIESVMDLLVDNKILVDDNYDVCGQLLLKFGGIDKQNPRVELKIICEN